MKELTKKMLCALANCCLLIFLNNASADDDIKNNHLRPVDSKTYKEECGACHFGYQPELLPSGSWEKILNTLPFHFSEEVILNQESKKEIGRYLTTNSSEYSSAELAAKILKSLNGKTSLRVTETPYILDKHHKITSDIFKHELIGSRSNCISCHPAASNGIYTPGDPEKGKATYSHICSHCHGENGEGILAPPFNEESRFKSKEKVLSFINIILPVLDPEKCKKLCPTDPVKFIMGKFHITPKTEQKTD